MKYWICICKKYDEDWQEEYNAEWEWWKNGEDGDRVLCYQTSAHRFTAELEVSEKFEANGKNEACI